MNKMKFLQNAGLLGLLLAVSPAVLAATPAQVGDAQYPFVVSIQNKAAGPDARLAHKCAGTLIAPDWVLTSAHCATLFMTTRNEPVPMPETVEVIVGRTVLGDETQGRRIQVRNFYRHPLYEGRVTSLPSMRTGYNVALFQLAEAVTDIEPVALPDADDKDFELDGYVFDSVGWNSQLPGGPESIVQRMLHIPLSFVPNGECRKASKEGLELCVADRSNTCPATGFGSPQYDNLPGDIGGPLFTTVAGAGPMQVGTLSFNQGCGALTHPSLFTRLANPEIAEFINQTLGLD